VDPVDVLIKSLNRDRAIALLIAACVCFVAAFSALAVEFKFVSPALRQFVPLIYAVALIAMSHGFLTMRLMSVVKTLAAFSKTPRPQ
jgi:hypothetical protein